MGNSMSSSTRKALAWSETELPVVPPVGGLADREALSAVRPTTPLISSEVEVYQSCWCWWPMGWRCCGRTRCRRVTRARTDSGARVESWTTRPFQSSREPRALKVVNGHARDGGAFSGRMYHVGFAGQVVQELAIHMLIKDNRAVTIHIRRRYEEAISNRTWGLSVTREITERKLDADQPESDFTRYRSHKMNTGRGSNDGTTVAER